MGKIEPLVGIIEPLVGKIEPLVGIIEPARLEITQNVYRRARNLTDVKGKTPLTDETSAKGFTPVSLLVEFATFEFATCSLPHNRVRYLS